MSDRDAHLRDLEQCVLGAVFLDATTLELLPALEPEDFFDLRARAVFGAMRAVQAANRPVDLMTVETQLAADGRLDAVGVSYLGECAMRVPGAANAVEYARLIRDAALARRVRVALSETLEAIKRDRMGGAEALTTALASISKLDAEQPEDARLVGDWVRDRCSELERIAEDRATGRVTLTGIPTGVAALDDRIGGWQVGIANIIAARPAMGKSSLALATADAATEADFGAHVFSLEDSWRAYADRSMSRQSGVAAEAMRSAQLTRGDLANLSPAIGRLRHRRNWLVDDRSGITAEEIVRSVRRHKRQNATRVVIVDYIQLVTWPREARNAHESITANITTFANAAKQDGLAFVVLSQLNRDLEKRADRRPMLSDLRESGSLEERSKLIVGMYRGSNYGGSPRRGVDFDCDCRGPEEHDQHAPSPEAWERSVQLLVLKNSNGNTGRVWASWHGPTTTVR